MEILLKDLEDLKRGAQDFLNQIEDKRVFAFKGQMGAGKTTFILSLLKAMGVKEVEGSPTYSLVNSYSSYVYGKIHHFDLYRLESEDEAYDIGIEEMLYSDEYCMIEWPEKIVSLLPENTCWVSIVLNDSNERVLTIEE